MDTTSHSLHRPLVETAGPLDSTVYSSEACRDKVSPITVPPTFLETVYFDLRELKKVSPTQSQKLGLSPKLGNFYLNKDALCCCLLSMGCGSRTGEWMEMKGNGEE